MLPERALCLFVKENRWKWLRSELARRESGARGGRGRLSQPRVSEPAKSPRRPARPLASGSGRCPRRPGAPRRARTLLPPLPADSRPLGAAPAPRRVRLLDFGARARSLPVRGRRRLAGNRRPRPPPPPLPRAPAATAQARGRLPLAPLPSPPDIPESSRRARARWSPRPLPWLWGARGAGCESRSQGASSTLF